MSIQSDLKTLTSLHEDGTIDDAQFAQAHAKLMQDQAEAEHVRKWWMWYVAEYIVTQVFFLAGAAVVFAGLALMMFGTMSAVYVAIGCVSIAAVAASFRRGRAS
ncbi:hypothetical protein [Actibacterium sp. 188UL27-1]|uniref:hypothetical protein n=1 Tax=Actibacterium sp. 188UL27-1 TaxID=2786961 RepID=UPI0019573A2B|nr:hypothetical protein [Actibacterium sp. 188UL27-1]MBM7070097.1 hypothetical protein [Actibacterium sp. 188UL27-1]